MNILKYRCLRLISFIGFRESSSPFVSAERCLSLRRPYLATRTEWACFFPVVYPCRALGYMSFHRLQYPRLRRLAVSDCSQDRALPVCRRLYTDLVVREAPESVTLFPARKLRRLPAQERLVDPEGASEHDSVLNP